MLSDVQKDMLIITARRGYTGADREVFFHYLKGIRYAEMEREVLALERQGLITIEWVGPSNFLVNITPEGVRTVKEIEAASWNKSQEALESMQKNRPRIRSVPGEDKKTSSALQDRADIMDMEGVPSDTLKKNEEETTLEQNELADDENPSEHEIGPAEEGSLQEMDTESEMSAQGGNALEEQEDGQSGEQIHSQTGEVAGEERITPGSKERMKRRAKERGMTGTVERTVIDGGRKMSEEKELQGVAQAEDGGKAYKENKQDGVVDKVSSDEEENQAISIENENDVRFTKSRSWGTERKAKLSSDTSIDDLSNIDIYKQIVEAISLHKPMADEDETTLIVSEELRCLWESERTCPLKLKKGSRNEVKVTPEHCMVCQLVEIKKLLKNSGSSTPQ